jgi:hypothetical protein
VEAIRAPIQDTSELESIIAAQAREPNSGVFVLPDAFTFAYRVEIVSLAVRYRLPAVYAFRFFTELGGLLSYGNDLNKIFDVQRPMPIASSRARSRASFPFRPQSSSSW